MSHLQVLVPASVAVPLVGAAVLGGANRLLPRVARDLLAVGVALATTVLSLLLVAGSADGPFVYWFSGWHPRGGVVIGVDFTVDPLGASLAALAGLLVCSALVYSSRFFDTVGGLYHTLLLIFLAASVDFCLTGDLFNLFVAFELVAVTGFVLTGYNAGKVAPLQGSLNFAVSNSLAGMVVLLGVALLYARTGALNLAQIGQRLAGHPADGLVIVAFALLAGGFLVKAAAVPFHFWLPDAYGTAPIPVCVLFSGVMSELGLFAVARVWETVFSGLGGDAGLHLRAVLVALGVVTALVGPVMALAQIHLKRMLAFLTMSHLGLYLIGFGLLTPLGVAGAGLLAVGDGLAKAAMFFGVGIIQRRAASVHELKLKGMGAGLPVAGVVVALGALAAADLPPFVSGAGKTLLVEAADPLGYGWVEAVVAFCVVVSSGAVLRAAGRIWLDLGPDREADPSEPETADDSGDPSEPPDADSTPPRPSLVLIVPPVVLLGVALALGLVPDLTHRAVNAATIFANRPGYVAAVVQGHYRPAVHPPYPTSGAVAVLGNVAEAAGAVALAALALNRGRWMAWVRRRAVAGVEWLREIHSGHVGDQVTWLLAGLALLAGACGLAMH